MRSSYMKSNNIINIFRNIITYITVLVAIGYLVYLSFNSNKCTTNEYMILMLLTLIATTFVLEMLDDERKWKNIQIELYKEITGISDCYILKYDNTIDWVNKMKEIMADGTHSFDSAALDKTTRSKSKSHYSSIWEFLNECSSSSQIIFRHILRVRHNNFENLLDRIISGNAKKNSYFAYYELPSSFSFPTFGVIDNRYICARSPYQQGETPCYLIIDNECISTFFVNYFGDLWRESKKVEKIETITNLLNKFDYSKNEKKVLQEKINKIKKDGIIDDI